jgi:phosphate transport system substrate-binding protein
MALCWSLLFLPACRNLGTGRSGAAQITLAGSTSVEPFAELLAERYMQSHPSSPSINVQGGGSSSGIQAALSGAADIGMSSRHLKGDELDQGLVTRMIARDAIAIVVHPSNAISDLTLAQVRDIFSGAVANWKDVGGEDSPIVVVTREEGSGTRGAFEELVMGSARITPSALRQDSNGAVRVIVASDRHAVGYVSLGLVNARVKALCLDGILARVENVLNGSYGLSRPFLFLWRGDLDPGAQGYVDYVLSAEGQGQLAREGLVTGGK